MLKSLKTFAIVTAVAVTSSFATWDYFPVLEAGKGSAEAGLYYDWHNDWSQSGLKIGARYSVIQNLEISLQSWGYQFWSEEDCANCPEGGDGLRDLTLGGRYQIDPMINVFLDLGLPIGGDESSSDEISIYLGGQFAMTNIKNAVPGLAFGTEAGLLWGFEHDNVERGLEIHIGGELDYTIPNMGLTPYIGLLLKLKLTEDSWETNGKEFGADNSGDTQINIRLGASYAINQMIAVKGELIVRSGDADNMGGDASGLYFACDIFF